MANKEQPKLYVIKKYVMAKSAAGAIRKDRDTPPHDVWVDEAWRDKNLAEAIGFHTIEPEVDEDDGD